MIKKIFEPSELHVLSSKGWFPANMNSPKYKNTYLFAKNALDFCQNKTTWTINDVFPHAQKIFNSGTIQTNIECHRMCTVLYCQQYDSETNGLRFMVYATKYNEDSTYGIGWGLNDIGETHALLHCPKNITAHFVH